MVSDVEPPYVRTLFVQEGVGPELDQCNVSGSDSPSTPCKHLVPASFLEKDGDSDDIFLAILEVILDWSFIIVDTFAVHRPFVCLRSPSSSSVHGH
jgi:hypothetical protein